jgi:hypothetical protein
MDNNKTNSNNRKHIRMTRINNINNKIIHINSMMIKNFNLNIRMINNNNNNNTNNNYHKIMIIKFSHNKLNPLNNKLNIFHNKLNHKKKNPNPKYHH